MGGYGSGPYGHAGSRTAKMATNTCLALDVRRLKKQGGLQPGINWTCSWGASEASIGVKVVSADEILLYYASTINGESTEIKTPISLTSSPCNYGHERLWFECPECDERVALLYLKGHYFKCRRCHDLTYYSCQESGNKNDMSMRRVNRVLRRLKSNERCSFDIVHYKPQRPRYMHRRTYHRLLERYHRKCEEYAASVRAKLGSFGVKELGLIDLPEGF